MSSLEAFRARAQSVAMIVVGILAVAVLITTAIVNMDRLVGLSLIHI